MLNKKMTTLSESELLNSKLGFVFTNEVDMWIKLKSIIVNPYILREDSEILCRDLYSMYMNYDVMIKSIGLLQHKNEEKFGLIKTTYNETVTFINNKSGDIVTSISNLFSILKKPITDATRTSTDIIAKFHIYFDLLASMRFKLSDIFIQTEWYDNGLFVKSLYEEAVNKVHLNIIKMDTKLATTTNLNKILQATQNTNKKLEEQFAGLKKQPR